MLPFPRISQYGNTVLPPQEDAYIGTINRTDLSYSTLQSYISASGTLIAEQATFRCFQFRLDTKIVIVPSQPLAYASYKEVYEKGMVYGTNNTGPDIFDASSGVSLTLQNSTVNILGNTYYIKLMQGIPGDTLSSIVIDSPSYNPSPNLEKFLYSIWSNATGVDKYYTVPSTDQVLKFSVGGTTRRWVLCQGSDGSRSTPRSVGRGRFESGITLGSGYGLTQVCTSSLSPLWTGSQNLWWPIFVEV